MIGRDGVLLWYALRHPLRPRWLLPAAIMLGLYAIDPLNAVLPFAGLIDEIVLVPLMLHALLKLLPQEIRDDFDRRPLIWRR